MLRDLVKGLDASLFRQLNKQATNNASDKAPTAANLHSGVTKGTDYCMLCFDFRDAIYV
jgi:hypothetical protein